MNKKIGSKRPSEVVFNEDKYLLEWVDSLIFAFFIATIIFVFIIQKAEVDGISMEPNLYETDQLLVCKLFYTPKKMDIIVADPVDFGTHIVKRVIGIPGDEIDFDFEKGELYINDVLTSESYIKEKMYRPNASNPLLKFPVVLGENQYFVMGDNRNFSLDSRYEAIGILNNEEILGRVVIRFWPFNRIGVIK